MTPLTYREERDAELAAARRRDVRDRVFFVLGVCVASLTFHWLLAITGGF